MIPLSDTYVGTKSRVVTVELTSRLAMNYAAAVDDANPCYFVDDQAEPLPVPPMAATSLTWRLMRNLTDHWAVAGFPMEVLDRKVHFRETLIFHRPMYQDTTLSLQAEIAAIQPHTAGTEITIRCTARDLADCVFVEEATALLRGVTCEGAGKARVDLGGGGRGGRRRLVGVGGRVGHKEG